MFFFLFNFFPSGRTKNPFLVDPSYEKWAPWIGEKTRIGNTVLNTEYEKVASAKVTSPDAQVLNVSEDRLVDELMKQKVKTLEIIKTLFHLSQYDSDHEPFT